ncbi:membrane-associated protease 1 [Listeria booriae]|uniref:membrane-associated protease 1 n=1 Tax=Listeria booriae TaxID=1552123 RepID=UPI00164E2FB0|nr:membrane-associated protease 1 [Listeria booriae]MBC6301279.1 membrane-associated protease 1 [Listeria booriae]
MGFKLNVEGSEKIDLGVDHILSVKFEMDTPDDSNARSTDVGVVMVICGKILTAIDGEAADSSLNIAKWSVIPAEQADCYRKVAVEVVNASQVVRKFTLPNAFVVDYAEDFGNTEGVGEFTLRVKQKKDKTEGVKLEGGYGM